MSTTITAREVIEKISQQLGANWKDSTTDVFNTGNPDTVVTGIATSFSPSIEVLQQCVRGGKNLIITQQPAYYLETEEYLQHDPTFLFKKEFIEKNKLVIWRFYDNWNARPVDGQLLGLARALGWDNFHISGSLSGEMGYVKNSRYFNLPEKKLSERIKEIEERLKINALRVIGNPDTKIKKASLSNSMFKLTELQEILQVPDIDLIVIAEAIEWESCEYFRDYLTWKGDNKALILIGREAAEDPGYNEVDIWLKTFIHEVPVEWISTKEPFWIP
jgi:putative NIF3 family GTP cyclohydrolase 1 type 2